MVFEKSVYWWWKSCHKNLRQFSDRFQTDFHIDFRQLSDRFPHRFSYSFYADWNWLAYFGILRVNKIICKTDKYWRIYGSLRNHYEMININMSILDYWKLTKIKDMVKPKWNVNNAMDFDPTTIKFVMTINNTNGAEKKSSNPIFI